MGQMEAVAPGPTNSTKLGGLHHKDNEIDGQLRWFYTNRLNSFEMQLVKQLVILFIKISKRIETIVIKEQRWK